ncbi:hypothetical protein Ppa06_12100 [Planomonospora parontospora subsp. parontospora]|uniref:Uncharacterized protein n=2 Tax=Planomonospora parontospora TaxID=58119 RepID=A0AA37BDT7_9ACTN|nr:hypothetical protein [Planomonospora parontospora]GGK55246.1 hypothetical protein GCM10010126_13480 [Planomonospora parontospora]GII07412.1 hypothetical protein Ppa06_12100 [Planomonospora parontospora subsp. parontospora]
MGFPGDSPRRQPYVQPGGQQPPFHAGGQQPPSAWDDQAGGRPGGQGGGQPGGQGESWFGPPAQGSGPQSPAGFGSTPQEPPRQAPGWQAPAEQTAAGQERHGPGAFTRETSEPTEPGRRPKKQKQAWSPYEEGPRALLPTFVAVGVIGMLVAGGIGLAVFASSGDDSPGGAADAPAPAATKPVIPANPGGTFGFAESRKTDPGKLTLDELFKSRKARHKGQTYLMTARRNDKKCKDAVVGSGLQKALTAGRCNQLVRASFRDASGKIIGTLGVANLDTSSAAAKVVKAARGKESQQYLKVLPGKDKVTKLLGTGEAFVGGWRHGHYAVLVWFQYKDGHLPSKAEAKKLNAAAFGVADATVTPALESRSLTGKRP